jgi:hypothetical protein
MHALSPTVGVGGGEHGALRDVAAEHEGGRARALPVGAIAALRLPRVHRPQPHRHQDPLLASHCSTPRLLAVDPARKQTSMQSNPLLDAHTHHARTTKTTSCPCVSGAECSVR